MALIFRQKNYGKYGSGDVPKEGSIYDLPIAVGILSSVLDFLFPKNLYFWENYLLTVQFAHTKGAFLMALFAKEFGFINLFVPKDSANEAAAIKGIKVFPVENLTSFNHFFGKKNIEPVVYKEVLENIAAARGV